MATDGDPKDPRGNKNEGKDAVTPSIHMGGGRFGLGPVAKYIAEYGGFRKALCDKEGGADSRDDELQDEGRVASAQEYLQWHNFEGKYPQSCVKYCAFKENSKLRAVFHYLQEKEWVLQADLVRRDDKEQVLAELRAIEGMLLWVVTNLGSHED